MARKKNNKPKVLQEDHIEIIMRERAAQCLIAWHTNMVVVASRHTRPFWIHWP